MTAKEHYQLAERMIETAEEKNQERLDFSKLTELEELPPTLKNLRWLRNLDLSGTNVSDISMVSDLAELEELNIESTRVSDLDPILKLPNLLRFSAASTPAANLSENESFLKRFPIRLVASPPSDAALAYRSTERFRKELEKTASQVFELKNDLERATSTQRVIENALKNSQVELADYREASDDRIAQVEKDYRESMAAAARAFNAEQAIKAPVTLWETKQKEHEATRDNAFRTFVLGLALVAVVCVILLVMMVKSPETVSALLGPVGCEANTPPTCDSFGLKGMIATAAVLTVLTVLLWFTRLQMKLYLAERHLVLDARERRAFAETYVGLLLEGDTSKEASEQRALVYSALFRPSSDGTIKDEGGIDPAVTAALSKLLSK